MARPTSPANIEPKPELSDYARSLLAWYDAHARTLPWRSFGSRRTDPYLVWLSEIMLQQTTVATVIPYFESFTEKWPTVEAMAKADLDDILHAWQGLGYYARARNLHKCAQVIASEYGGVFPNQEKELLKLPGIGPYTAAAIAAIAFNQPTVPVDGNIERVISRLNAIDELVQQSKDRVRDAATKILPADRPGDFAQALMDLGATVCRPKTPLCESCCWVGFCEAHKDGNPEAFPVKPPKKAKPTRYGVVFWLENETGEVWTRKRAEKGLLGGMTEFPSTDWGDMPWPREAATEAAPIDARWQELPGAVKHTFTHFHLELTVFTGTFSGPTNREGAWCHPAAFSKLALPTLMKKVARHAAKSNANR